MADRGVVNGWQLPGRCDERRSVDAELFQPWQPNVHVHSPERIGRQLVPDRGERLGSVQRA